MPDNCACEMKHAAQCYVTLKCCVEQHILFVCDIGKHNGMYQNRIAHSSKGKGKVIPLQARCGPEGG